MTTRGRPTKPAEPHPDDPRRARGRAACGQSQRGAQSVPAARPSAGGTRRPYGHRGVAAGVDVATLAKVEFAYPTYSAAIGVAARRLLEVPAVH